MTPTVSVILPAYNRPDALPVAMRSVLDQSFRDLELIVVDDASTENIEDVIKGLDDSRVRYVRHAVNGGAAAARNTGLAQARGRYIAFQDSDDMWLPGKLEHQVKLLESQPPEVGAVIGGKILYGRDARRRYGPGKVVYAPDPGRCLTGDEDQLRRSLVENRISLQNAIFRRDSLPEDPCFDPVARANVDWGFTVRLAQKTRIHEELAPVVFSYISSDSISRNTRQRAIAAIRILKRNRHVYDRYPGEYGVVLFSIGSMLEEVGHKKLGRQALLGSIRLRPKNALRLAGRYVKQYLLRAQPGRRNAA